MKMDSIYRELAKSDCKDSVENIYHTIKEFPELVMWDDDFIKIEEHLNALCKLLMLSPSWDEDMRQ